VKDNIKGTGRNDVYENRHSISNISGSVAELNIGYSIEKFPKEFKKNFFSSIDYRFLFILIFSFVINIINILYFENITSIEIDSKMITKIQKQYAHLLLDSSKQSAISQQARISSDFDQDTQMITGLAQWVENFDLNIFDSINNLSPLEETGNLAEEEKRIPSYSKEELDALRKSNAEKRFSSRSELEREVGSVGLLGIISSKGRNSDYEYIQDLIEYAAKNSDHLSTVLSKLKAIEIPRYGSRGYLRKLEEISGYEKIANFKGERKSPDKQINNLVKNMERLNKAKTETIARNVQYEKVKSSYFRKLPQSNAVKRERSSEDVIRVVRSHMRTLQDCYKQELKNDPGLKGRIIVRFVIDPDGVVIQSSMVSSTLNSPRMENCILMRVNRWRNFPPCDPSFGNMTYRQKFAFGM